MLHLRLGQSIALVLLFTLSACIQKPVFNIEVEQPALAAGSTTSPTPLPTATEISLPSPTPVVDFLPILSPTPVVWPRDFSPVLYGGNRYGMSFFLLLGGVSINEWLPTDASVARYGGEATYSLHTLTQLSKYFIWGKVPQYSPTCGNYFINTDSGLDEPRLVGVVDGWYVAKREVTDLSTNRQLYEQSVVEFLTAMGVTASLPNTLQVFLTDIEGDGVDEVFISATHLDDSQHTTKAGDYSIVLMRKVIENDAVTKLVVGDYYNSPQPEITYPRTYSLANFIDLNQDGVLEVVVDIQKWEGFGASVFQVNGQNVIQALSAVC